MNDYAKFVIAKSINDFNHYYRVNPVPFYDEADLLKDIIVKDLYENEDNSLTMEHYSSINFISGYWVAYCYNSLTPFARKEKYVDGYGSLFAELHNGSSILEKGDNGIREIDVECPKVAWGFTAFLITHARFDEDKLLRADVLRDEVSFSCLMDEYFESQKNNFYKLNEAKYRYYQLNGLDDKVRELDAQFLDEHIKQEQELLSKSNSENVYFLIGEYLSYVDEYLKYVEKKKLQPNNGTGRVEIQYSEELLRLFRNHTELLDELFGLSNDEIAIRIRKWGRERDKLGKPLIENPDNRFKAEYARLLKEAGIITCSVRTFRGLL